METLRIAILTENLPPARLNLQPWRYLGDLAKALQVEGHDTSVVTADEAGQEWNGVHVDGSADVAAFRSGSSLRQMMETRRFDGGICRLTAGLFFSMRARPRLASRAGRLAGIFLRPLHNGAELSKRFLDPRLIPELRLDKHHAAMYASRVLGTWPFASSFVDHFIFLWESDRQRAVSAGLPTQSCTVIRHPFDPFFEQAGGPDMGSRLSPILPPVARRVVFSGPPEESRGLHDVLQIAHGLRSESPTQLVLLLRDGRFHELTTARSRIGPHELVVVRGLVSRDELRAVYRQAHVAVFPYRFVRTGLPLVALEAVAAGLPVVTTRVHPIRELEGRTGLVFANPRDVPDIVGAIHSILDEGGAPEIRQRNEEWIRATPDWRSVAKTFVAVLRG